jgi:predicted ribosome quality control (RQC) complex YloA/Tae2 family protein
VRYDAVNAMLLDEFLKAHRAFLDERRKVEKLETALEAVNKRLKEQEAKIQKVRDEVEMNRSRPQLVNTQSKPSQKCL